MDSNLGLLVGGLVVAILVIIAIFIVTYNTRRNPTPPLDSSTLL